MNRQVKLKMIALALLCLFVVMLGYGILLPTLPYYTERLALKDNLDVDLINFHIGLLTSVYPLFQLIFVIFWGRLSDKYGRKPIILIGMMGFILMQVLTGLATSLAMLYIARIFGGIFTSSVIPVSNAYLSDVTSEKRRTKVMAWSGVAISSGVIFGPVLGGFLSQTDVHWGYRWGILHLDGFTVPFILVALFGLITLFVVAKWLIPFRQDFAKSEVRQNDNRIFSISKFFMVLLVVSFVLQFAVTLFETVFSIYAKDELFFKSSQVGIGFMLCGLVMAILQPIFATYGQKVLSSKNQIKLGLLIAGIALILFPFFKTEALVYVIIVIFATGGSMVIPNLLSSVSLISNENTGRNISIQTSVNSIGQISGPITGTWLIAGGFYFPFILAGVTILLALLLVLPLLKLNT